VLQTVAMCMCLNIPCVTVYVFAIDNFHRPSEEVHAIMNLVAEKLVEVAQKG
jgi:ditrans,polycis-polyprenyl diphosphate synthase